MIKTGHVFKNAFNHQVRTDRCPIYLFFGSLGFRKYHEERVQGHVQDCLSKGVTQYTACDSCGLFGHGTVTGSALMKGPCRPQCRRSTRIPGKSRNPKLLVAWTAKHYTASLPWNPRGGHDVKIRSPGVGFDVARLDVLLTQTPVVLHRFPRTPGQSPSRFDTPCLGAGAFGTQVYFHVGLLKVGYRHAVPWPGLKEKACVENGAKWNDTLQGARCSAPACVAV